VGSFAVGIGLALAACSLFLVVGVTLMSVADSSMPALTGYANVANTTMYSYVSASYNGLDLMSALPIVLIAAVIICLITGGYMALAHSGMLGASSSSTTYNKTGSKQ